MLGFTVLLIFCLTETYQREYELPKFITPCQNNLNLSICARRILEDVRPYLTKGIPEFQIPSVDPLIMESVIIEKRNSHIANYLANMTNVRWTGVKDFKIIEFFLNPQDLIFRLKLLFPTLLMDTEAHCRGSLLSFEVDGTGGTLVNITNVVLDIILNGELYKYQEKEFINWTAEDVVINYDDFYYVDLYGFFENPAITNLWRLALNRGIRLMSPTFRTLLSSISDFILQATNRVHNLFPKNVLYAS